MCVQYRYGNPNDGTCVLYVQSHYNHIPDLYQLERIRIASKIYAGITVSVLASWISEGFVFMLVLRVYFWTSQIHILNLETDSFHQHHSLQLWRFHSDVCGAFEEPELEDPHSQSFFSKTVFFVSDVRFSHSGPIYVSQELPYHQSWGSDYENKAYRNLPGSQLSVHQHLYDSLECSLVCDVHYCNIAVLKDCWVRNWGRDRVRPNGEWWEILAWLVLLVLIWGMYRVSCWDSCSNL